MISLLKDAVSNGYQQILVLQDDIYFHKRFKQNFHKIYNHLLKERNWKFCWLGANQFNWEAIDLQKLYYKPTNHTYGGYAIGIHSSVFNELILDMKKRSIPCDWVFKNIAKKYKRKSFIIYPNLIIPDVSKSLTDNDKNQIKFSKKKRWDLKFYDVSDPYYEQD